MKCSRINTSLQAAVETKPGSAAALPTSQLIQPTPGWDPGCCQVLLLWRKMLHGLINWDRWTASFGDTQGFPGIMEWPWHDFYFSSSRQRYRALKRTLFLGIWMYSWWRFSFWPWQFSNSSILISLFFLNVIYCYLILHLFPRTLSRNIIPKITVSSAKEVIHVSHPG